MLEIIVSNAFKKDIKLAKKRGKKFEKIKKVIEKLELNQELPPSLKDHKLVGNYVGYRECHIEPDWLLIYKIKDNFLYLVRTGSHSDLFE